MFHYTVETKKTLDEAIESLSKSLKTHNLAFCGTWIFLQLYKVRAWIFHNPTGFLESAIHPKPRRFLDKIHRWGTFLPCKIVVYEEDGTVRMGFPRPSMLMEVIQDPSLKAVAEEVEQTLMTAVNEAM